MYPYFSLYRNCQRDRRTRRGPGTRMNCTSQVVHARANDVLPVSSRPPPPAFAPLLHYIYIYMLRSPDAAPEAARLVVLLAPRRAAPATHEPNLHVLSSPMLPSLSCSTRGRCRARGPGGGPHAGSPSRCSNTARAREHCSPLTFTLPLRASFWRAGAHSYIYIYIYN